MNLSTSTSPTCPYSSVDETWKTLKREEHVQMITVSDEVIIKIHGHLLTPPCDSPVQYGNVERPLSFLLLPIQGTIAAQCKLLVAEFKLAKISFNRESFLLGARLPRSCPWGQMTDTVGSIFSECQKSKSFFFNSRPPSLFESFLRTASPSG